MCTGVRNIVRYSSEEYLHGLFCDAALRVSQAVIALSIDTFHFFDLNFHLVLYCALSFVVNIIFHARRNLPS